MEFSKLGSVYVSVIAMVSIFGISQMSLDP